MVLSTRDRRGFIGGSDARIIMGDDEAALVRLWREKRGEIEPEDFSANLIVQLGIVTEELNRHWYERHTGQVVTEVQRQVFHPVQALDGGNAGRPGSGDRGGVRGQVHAAVDVLGGSRRRKAYGAAPAQYVGDPTSRSAALSIITGGGKWVELTIHADPLYQHLLLTAERKFWRCVENGEAPHLFGIEAPRPRIEAVRVIDMSGSNSWAEFAGIYCRTRSVVVEHEAAKSEFKKLMPEDAKEAAGHGVRAKRSKSGSISFQLLEQENGHAELQ